MQEMAVKEVNKMSLSFAKDFIKYTNLELHDIKRKFFKIGFRLNEANEFEYFKALGYPDIYALAEAEFGFKSTTTKNLMEVNRVYSDHLMSSNALAGSTTHYRKFTMEIDPRYDKYSQTQLVEMLPLSTEERAHVPADFKTQDLRDYKKAVGGRYSYGIGYTEAIENPRKAVEEYRRVMEKSADYMSQKEKDKMISDSLKAIDKLIKPKSKTDDVPPGQLYLDEDENVTEFYQSQDEDPGQLTDQTQITDLSKFVLSKEEFAKQSADYLQTEIPKRPIAHNFKNRKEREEFILNEKNYTVSVLENEELNIKVRRLDLANGAKIYRTDWCSYNEYKEQFIPGYTLHLVDKTEREPPERSHYCQDYTCSGYTLTGTPIEHILDYLTMYKDQI